MGRRILIWLASGAALGAAFVTGFELQGRTLSGDPQVAALSTPSALRTAVLADLQQSYYLPVPPRAQQARTVPAILRTLRDPYTEYLTPVEYNDLLESERGSFAGLGLALSRVRRGLLVRSLLPGLPASRAGIKAGDVVTRVNHRDLRHVPYLTAVELMHGAVGTQVHLEIARPGRDHPMLLTLVRQPVTVSAVSSRVITSRGRRVLVVRVPALVERTAQRVRAAVQKAAKHHLDGVVLDLRGDTGGILDESVGVARVFVNHGLIVATDGLREPRESFSANGTALKVPRVAVLIDGATASAAEIVAGSLQHYGAVVVGTRSFGKGTVQAVRPLPGGGALKLTVASFTLAGDRVVDGRGIRPAVLAPDSPASVRDETLLAALAALRAA